MPASSLRYELAHLVRLEFLVGRGELVDELMAKNLGHLRAPQQASNRAQIVSVLDRESDPLTVARRKLLHLCGAVPLLAFKVFETALNRSKGARYPLAERREVGGQPEQDGPDGGAHALHARTAAGTLRDDLRPMLELSLESLGPRREGGERFAVVRVIPRDARARDVRHRRGSRVATGPTSPGTRGEPRSLRRSRVQWAQAKL